MPTRSSAAVAPPRRITARPQSFTHHVNNQAARGAPLLLPGVQESRQLSQAPGEESEVQLLLADLAVFDDSRGSLAQVDDGKLGFVFVRFKGQQARNRELPLFQNGTPILCRVRTKLPPPPPGTLP